MENLLQLWSAWELELEWVHSELCSREWLEPYEPEFSLEQFAAIAIRLKKIQDDINDNNVPNEFQRAGLIVFKANQHLSQIPLDDYNEHLFTSPTQGRALFIKRDKHMASTYQ